MSVAGDLAVNLAAGAIGAGAGALVQPVRAHFRTRGPRRFWRPFVAGKQVRVVIGGPSLEGNAWEESGLMGVGDTLALRDLQSDFARIGAEVDVRLASHIARSELADCALVSLGGPDSSHVTKALTERAETTLRFGDPESHEVAISDLLARCYYEPRIRSGTGVDYGLILRLSRSEVLHHAEAVVIGGSFGYGTWAGARLMREKQFLENRIVRSKSPFECLYKTAVAGGHLGGIEILALRPLSGEIRASDDDIDPRWIGAGGRGSTFLGPGWRRPEQMPDRASTEISPLDATSDE
ncbi:hypothetical protein ACFCV3_41035 [Kribbella sp. NPDC056345]|uniref:hypothetical protein n=1 Tax=Kribbella sp. NPDC056345 TaxID=3345789 RepID=UPI0035D72091